jgi:hypothetical protein
MSEEKSKIITKNESGESTTIGDDTDDTQRWYSGSVALGLEDDKYWLSELQVFLRANFAEAFGADEEDIAAPMHGRNKPIALGQVGIRCMHCKRKYNCAIQDRKFALSSYNVYCLPKWKQTRIPRNVASRQLVTPV